MPRDLDDQRPKICDDSLVAQDVAARRAGRHSVHVEADVLKIRAVRAYHMRESRRTAVEDAAYPRELYALEVRTEVHVNHVKYIV